MGSRTGIRHPLPVLQEPPSFLRASILCEISVVIYPSLLFILLLHLSVILAYPQVHVSSAILSGALWTAVALIVLFRGYIHINGVRVLVVGI